MSRDWGVHGHPDWIDYPNDSTLTCRHEAIWVSGGERTDQVLSPLLGLYHQVFLHSLQSHVLLYVLDEGRHALIVMRERG